MEFDFKNVENITMLWAFASRGKYGEFLEVKVWRRAC